jgi:hypothetical protein
MGGGSNCSQIRLKEKGGEFSSVDNISKYFLKNANQSEKPLRESF